MFWLVATISYRAFPTIYGSSGIEIRLQRGWLMPLALFLALVLYDSLQVMDEVGLGGRLPSVALPLGKIGAIRGGVSSSKDIVFPGRILPPSYI